MSLKLQVYHTITEIEDKISVSCNYRYNFSRWYIIRRHIYMLGDSQHVDRIRRLPTC